MKRLILGTVIAALPFAAHAADLYSPPPAPTDYAPVASHDFNWTGPYIGLHAGWAWDNSDYKLNNGGFWGLAGDNSGIDSNGFIGGGQIGYLYQAPSNLVFGVDVSGSWADLSGSTTSPAFATDTWSADIDWFLLAQARIGWAAGRWLLFAQGGYAGADGSASASGLGVSASDDQWHNGWTAGAGVSYKVSRSVSLGVEYNYVDLESKDYSLGAGQNASVDHQINVVKGTLNFHF